MPRSISSVIFCLILFTFSAQVSLAQEQPAATQQEARKATQEKALALLEEIIKAADTFRLAENKVYIQIMAADLLWPRDERRARLLFKEATKTLNDLVGSTNQDALESYEALAVDPQFLRIPFELRRQMLQLLAKRDPRLAREFLRSTRQSLSNNDTENENQLELSLAAQIAASDPKEALQIAEESLAKGISYQLPEVIAQLRQKDHQAAAKLADKLLTKLRSENLAQNHQAAGVALQLLRLETQPRPVDPKSAEGSLPSVLDQQALRQLVEMVAAAALSASSNNPELLSTLQSMLPEVEKYAPARAPQLRRRTTQSTERRDPQAASWREYQALSEKGTAEALLAAAAKAPPETRNLYYQRAAAKAIEQGNADQARQIINEHVSDVPQRKRMLAEVDQLILASVAGQGKLDETRRLLAGVRTNEERVMILTQLASAMEKTDQKSALQLLEEARGLVSYQAKNFKQLGAQFQVARSYVRLDPVRSLTMLDSMVDQLNELLAAGILLGGFFTEELVKDDELMMPFVGNFTGGFLNVYVAELSQLAHADFERTKTLTDKFQRDEVRLIARLLVVQSVLSDELQKEELNRAAPLDNSQEMRLRTNP